MLAMMTVLADGCDPSFLIKTYTAYTNEELSGGKPHVLVR